MSGKSCDSKIRSDKRREETAEEEEKEEEKITINANIFHMAMIIALPTPHFSVFIERTPSRSYKSRVEKF